MSLITRWKARSRTELAAEIDKSNALTALAEAAPCGNRDNKHRYWEGAGWPCPVCARMEKDQAEDEKQSRLAKKIAAELHRLSRGQP